jgi:hypothetical protein
VAAVPSSEASLRLIADAAAVKAELAISAVELDRKSAQLEALNKLVSYLKVHSSLFSSAVPTIPLAAGVPAPSISHTANVYALQEALSSRCVEVAFWRESHEQMATALLFAEEELRNQTQARIQCEEQLRSASVETASALAAAQHRYSVLQEQVGDLIAQTEELSRIITAKDIEMLAAGERHTDYVTTTTRLLEQQELALAELQRHTISISNHHNLSVPSFRVASDQHINQHSSSRSDAESVEVLRLQVQELEEQLLHQSRVTRPNLNPSYQPSHLLFPTLHASASDYVPPPLPPSDVLDEVGFIATNTGSMICLASDNPSSMVAAVSSSLNELGRFAELLAFTVVPSAQHLLNF